MTESDLPTRKLRVLIADDHRMILDMLALFLSTSAGLQVAVANDLDDAVLQVQQSGPYDVVLLDLNMPGMNGVQGLRRMVRLNHGNPVGIITSSPTARMTDEILNSAAAGIVLKTTPFRSLANAIRFMHAGERYLPMELMRRSSEQLREARKSELSERENKVLEYLVEGQTNKAIAVEMQLAEPTVKMHVTAICRKLGAHNRTHAVVLARDLGLV
ncbi:response regulator transcription factor [Tabrizicola soli]|uniref:Response regulator n=1 Tax=Tabrizicola soli TaxID=2185115 RepID=A0ABV7DWR6_9RHOB|nr:response regulator transcription factor [Tabrizicola soli]